jgi:Flp pilus assembly pilin Flp
MTSPSFAYLALCHLRHDERGATAIEFACVAPVLLILMFGTIEFSLIMLTQGLMDSATFNASRLGKTGYIPTGLTREEAIRQRISEQAGVLVRAQDLAITTQVYGSFDNINQPEPFTDSNRNGRFDNGEVFVDTNGNGGWDADMARAGLGGAGDVVVYTIDYPWRIQTPIIGYLFNANSTVSLSVRAVVKNEPF